MRDKILGGIIGLCVGDALGVPFEFMDREKLRANPVTDMCGGKYFVHDQPAGTWSDDTSMTLCLLDSLANGLDYNDIMQKFLSWINNAEYTAHGKVFDYGVATRAALTRYEEGTEPLLCGGMGEYDNGNGSLMRILPIVFYLASKYGENFNENTEAYDIIHNVSALTHAHTRSKIACGIYISIAGELLRQPPSIGKGVERGIEKAKAYYENKSEYSEELRHYFEILNPMEVTFGPFADWDEAKKHMDSDDHIKSTGYVVDTLDAALWCVETSVGYEDCVLDAVNLGGDTDTIAAIAGGLAGLYYGYDAIPEKWIKQIARLDYIKELCEGLLISEAVK